MRQITDAAGQKNHAAVGDRFGSEKVLVRALVQHRAMLIDQRHNIWLDGLDNTRHAYPTWRTQRTLSAA